MADCDICLKPATHNVTWGDGVVTHVCDEIAKELLSSVGKTDPSPKYQVVSIEKIGE